MPKHQRSPAPLLLAVLLVVAVGMVATLAFLDDPPEAAAVAGSSDRNASGASTRRSTTSASDELSLDTDTAGDRDANTAASAALRSKTPLADRTERDFANVVWVEGRVVFPVGTPLDESVEVIADGKDIPGVGKHRAPADGQGRFRVAFSKASKTGTLKLKARFLHLDTPRVIKLSSPPADLTLEPLLGGCIAGRIVPPRGVGADDVRAITNAAAVKATSWAGQGMPTTNKADIDADLRYELGGLPSALAYGIEFKPKGWVAFSKSDVKVVPGEVVTLDIDCALGARLSGIVVDARGAPVASASIEVHSIGKSAPVRWRGSENSTSGKDGRFLVSGIPAGEYRLEVERRGFRDFKLELGELADGDVREGLELTLDEGAWVSGVVKWSDGRAAEGAYVRAEVAAPDSAARARFDFNMDDMQRVGPDGAFRISGLDNVPLHVFATAKDGLRPDLVGADPSTKRGASKGARWRAQALNVAPGQALELILQPGLGLAGRVVDDRGEPVREFWISAMEVREERTGLPIGFEDAVSTKFEAEDGSFLLEGLKPGRWKIGARARGHVSASAPDADVPAPDPLLIVLQRTATITGVVVDPRGERVAKAEIRVDVDQRDLFTMTDVNRTTSADGKGEFKLRSAPSGAIKLSARHAQFARSTPLALTVPPGGSLEGLRLVLSGGGRLKGRFHEARLAGDATWRVWINAVEGEGYHNTTSDARGEFEIERIAPGEYNLRATRVESSGAAKSGVASGRNELSAKVTISEGATTEVLLGAPTGESITARGRVTMAGNALEGARIEARRDDFSANTRTAADGSYAIVLEGAGEYAFTARMPEGGVSRRESATAVSGADLVVDFDFPGGRIGGRVVDRRGEVVPSAQVRVQRTGTGADAGSGRTGSAETSATGEFNFDGLAGGEYKLIVEDRQNWFRSRARFARTELTGLVLEDGGALEGLEVVVEPASDVTCEVRGLDGQPAAGATVVARRTDTSEIAGAGESVKTSGIGVAVFSGLAEGEYVLIARKGEDVGVSTSRVRVRGGNSEQAAVQLRRGGQITLQVQSATGEPRRAAMRVIDGDGIDWTRGGADWSFDERGQRWTLGPLASGSYRVSAELSSEGSAAANVRVSGGGQENVLLRLSKD